MHLWDLRLSTDGTDLYAIGGAQDFGRLTSANLTSPGNFVDLGNLPHNVYRSLFYYNGHFYAVRLPPSSGSAFDKITIAMDDSISTQLIPSTGKIQNIEFAGAAYLPDRGIYYNNQKHTKIYYDGNEYTSAYYAGFRIF